MQRSEIINLMDFVAECGGELNILWQSIAYFVHFLRQEPLTPGDIAELSADLNKYRSLLSETDNSQQVSLRLWQLPLGLLFCLKLLRQQQLINSFFIKQLALPLWYENILVAKSCRALVLKPYQSVQDLAKLGRYLNSLGSPLLELPWSLPRLSPAAKSLLQFRLNGFRCSASELLLFLAFAPLSQLCGTSMTNQEGGTASSGISVVNDAQRTSEFLAVERQPNFGNIVARLDFQLFELFGGNFDGQSDCCVEDMLRREYREALRALWCKIDPV